MKTLAIELKSDYESQYSTMEDFARWNLPDEIALEWIDAEGMIEILFKDKWITDELYQLLTLIVNNFITAFKTTPEVYSHEAMKKSEFWDMQRDLAEKALTLFKE